MSTITEQVGRLIRETRNVKGLTQQDLADKLGVSKPVVSRYEGGKQNVTIETLEKIGEVLNATLSITYK